MKANEFIHLNSRGKPIYNYPQFKLWFKNSVAVDSQGHPLVVYHGTGSSFEEFSLDFRSESQGNDQYGPGFYTTTDPGVAGGYTDGKNPNIIPLYVSIQQPLNDTSPTFSSTIVKKLITSSPNFEDAILNFGDPKREGMSKVLNSAVRAFSFYDNPLQQLMTIQGDFWSGVSTLQYLKLVTKLTGYDGTAVNMDTAGIIFVAWQPNQLKSAIRSDYTDSGSIVREDE